MYNDTTIDQFIVDFYHSYPSEIKVDHALGWSLFGISDTIEISTKNFTSSIALEPLDNVDGLDVLIYRTIDCAIISRHVMLFDGSPYFNAMYRILRLCGFLSLPAWYFPVRKPPVCMNGLYYV